MGVCAIYHTEIISGNLCFYYWPLKSISELLIFKFLIFMVHRVVHVLT